MLEGLTQDYQLTLPYILRRAEQLYGYREIVTRRPDKTFHRHTFADFVSRSKRLAVAIKGLGLEPGDRVGTLGWNTYQHLEAYFGVPSSGAVLHTLNPRLHEDDLAYIANHAGDRVMLVDETLVPVFEKFRDRTNVEHAVVVTEGGDVPDGMISYEDLLSGADEAEFEYPDFDERQAAAMCYTSGTTGRPKGALYSHRSTVLHSMMAAMGNTFALSEADCVLPVVPMFHVNAWGLPFASVLVGAKLMMPGPHLDPASLLEDFEQEGVTFTAGVPTVFLAVLQTLDAEPERYDLSRLRSMVIGGAAAPKGVVKAFEERHGIDVVHAWGMTEMSPIGTVANLPTEIRKLPEEEQLEYRAKQGYPVPLVEIRARGDEGFVPWDGESLGELEVRGPWIASSYYEAPEGDDKFTEDGWFKTGDIVTIDGFGFIKIADRSKDLIKSGGEWISSVELENALMAHPAVAQAAVIAIPHEKWDERPLAAIVLKEGESATEEDLRKHLENDFAKFWLPDAYEFVESIPMTATGKFQKLKLREQFEGLPDGDELSALLGGTDLKVIGAGFGRTGTTSLKAALETLGFGPCYHMVEVFEHPEHADLWRAAWREEPIDWGDFLAGYEATVDWPACTFYEELMERYPDAKVLLSVRDPEPWYESTRNTIYELSKIASGSPLSRVVFALVSLFVFGAVGRSRMGEEIIWQGTFDGRFGEDKPYAIEVFERHNEEVRRRVPEDRLLVYEVKQGWGPLCESLGVEEPDEPFPRLNDTAEMRRRIRVMRAISLAVPAALVLLALAALALLRRRA